jgi:hypothetical protein
MSEARRCANAFGLSLVAALCVMALGAPGAQAAGEFLIEEGGVKKTFVEHNVTSSEFLGNISKTVEFLSTLFTVACETGGIAGTASAGGTVQVTILYEGCEIPSKKECLIYETQKTHESGSFDGYFQITGTGELILHSSNHYVTLKGNPLGTIWIGNTKHETPNTCKLPLSVTVSGTTALKLPNALTPAVSQVVKTLSAAEETALKSLIMGFGLTLTTPTGTKFAAHPKEGGEGNVHLVGPLLNKLWGAH